MRLAPLDRTYRTAHTLQRIAEDELDLRVQAPEVIVGPALHRFQYRGVEPEEKRLPIGHDLLMNRAGVQDGLCGFFAAKHDEQVADHVRLSLLVELDD